MAGIGFELRRLTQRQDYTGLLRAYASAAVISTGPWIISIISLMLLTWMLHRVLKADEVRLLSSTITHVYAFALILTGPVQLVLTRYISDCLAQQKREAVAPSFLGAVGLMSVISGVGGGWFFLSQVPVEPLYQIAAAALLVHVCAVFIASTYLSALREHGRIVLGFFLGYAASIAAANWLAKSHGVSGAMMGFLAGHVILFAVLTWTIHREFGRGHGHWFGFLPAFFKFPALLLCGLCYNLAIWVDKLLFWWFSQTHVEIAGALRAAPDYDLAIYLSLLSIVPGMAVFFLQVETSFSICYQQFYRLVNEGGSLRQITDAKWEMIRTLREGFLLLLKVQGLTTLILVIFSNDLATWFNIGFVQTGIFRITLFGAFLLVVFLSMLTVLFYFDDHRGALLSSFVFLAANALLSYLTLLQNEAWYGFGFVLAAGCALAIAAHRVNRRLRDLEWLTFSS
jgi:polysaccharide biosynthesis protein PelG